MQPISPQEEIILLEERVKAITEEFDNAIKKDMALKDVKILYQELKILSVKLSDLRKQHAGNER
jgi:hypothetical protein